ncbi:putative membrane-type matrix metalloproteinase-1 [Medicago truncatula]|uniref:Putative membrane-type matrix metalloproteinase-1 n=1 Tax=Medicago truncatula TaxID=3880 RepID=A0A396HWT9_MEDTR|nr:putative membrane-type matrix metalloproteinase-1 [Medicago truncatula]
MKIQGLSQIKKHLSTFGYFRQFLLKFDDVLDEETISAIKTYQQFFNLQVTGNLNTETLQKISLPRCGIPDMRYEYGFDVGSDVSFPKGNKWFPKGTKKLTYGKKFSLDMIEGFRNAFTRWSQTTRVLNFSETTSYDDADIKIGFYHIYNNDIVDDVVVGDSFISRNLDSNVKSGMIRLERSKFWVSPTTTYFKKWELQEFDLETVVMHQIGHLLGLDHSSDKESIMYPLIDPLQEKKVQITDSDNQAIQQLYTNTAKANPNSDHSGCFKLFESSMFLLAFCPLVLLL